MTGRIGDYVYDKFLGEGSFGKVYKGCNAQNKEEVAVKQMEMIKLSDPYMLDSLEKEISVMKALKSPNIVKLYDVIREPKYTYIILELCQQGDLDKYIEKSGGMLKETIAIDILKQLMHGFKELASHNYIHRDIKPTNCLIKDNVFKIADFGFACEADIKGKTLIRECVGTPLFMAPQLLENLPYTAKSDIWSIGMMFFLMIFGGTPWAARDPKSFLENMKRYPIKFPYDKPIAQDTKNFIQRCLTIEENSRIGWEEIFNHPLILEQHEDKQVDHHHIKLDEISKKILAKLQQMIHINNLQPRQLFKKFDQDYGGSLDQGEFYQMLLSIDPNITFKESVQVFQQIDTSNDGKISIQEFNDIITDFDFHDLKDRAGRLINDLKDIIRANNYDLKQLFQKYDTDKTNLLDINEFAKLMKDLAPGLKPTEIQLIFAKLDQNGDSNIVLDEFQKTLQYGLQEIQQTDSLQKEKALKIVKELKAIIRIHRLDITEIFRSYDKDRNGQLDQQEFFQLIMTIDPNAHIEDVQSVFDIFTDHQNSVSMNDFYSHLC